MAEHRNIRIHGDVQGVFFRAQAKETADRLDLSGFARNQPDGSVLIEAEGEPEHLERFIKWCHEGPASASVAKVEVTDGDLVHYGTFETL